MTAEIESDFFEQAEIALNVKIPSYLKKLFIANGYSNPRIMSTITNEDFSDTEDFAKNTLPNIIEESEYQDYFGIFYKKIEAFKIVTGHRKLIMMIADFFKKKLDNNKNEEESADKNMLSASISSSRASSGSKEHKLNDLQGCSSGSSSSYPGNTQTSPNLTEENYTVLNTIRNWIKENSNTNWGYFKEKIKNITVSTKLDSSNNLVCSVKCFCKSDPIKIYKRKNREKWQPRWIAGNFYRHFKNHFENTAAEENQQNTSKGSKVASGIRKYFKSAKEQSFPQKPNVKEKHLHEITSSPDKKIHIISNVPLHLNLQSELETIEPSIESLEEPSEEPEERREKDFQGNEDESINQNFWQSRNWQTVEGLDNSCSTNLTPSRTSELNDCCIEKWKSLKYGRTERRRRAREKSVRQRNLITDFFPILEKVQTYISENPDINLQLLTNIENFQDEKKTLPESTPRPYSVQTNNFLKMLYEVSFQNSEISSHRNQFNDTLKKFSLYLYYIGGRLVYETLQANLKNILPSISCLNRYVHNNSKKIEEGEFDFQGLLKFLEDRNLPKYVWVSEDATRITTKIEYDPTTNKIMGFVLPLKNGLPQTNTYLATSAKVIQKYFRQAKKANYAYAIMVQPLSECAPPYCLTVFGTDNKFIFKDIQDRWKEITDEAKKYGIHVIGFSSDGDTRLLKAMRLNAVLPIPSGSRSQLNGWEWFQMGFENNVEDNHISYVQDTVHILTKLRTRLLKPGIILPCGEGTLASVTHLKTLLNEFSKDQHLLTSSDLKPEDKMNYQAAQRMCSDKVIQLLEEKVPGSEGTVAYLKIMRYAILSYIDKDTPILLRIYYIWYCVFFLRIWRKWIQKNGYKIQDNFLSTNCYLSLELNAHSLIKVLLYYQQNKDLQTTNFLPWLFSSQICEQLFRTTRSLTSTLSTVINFSIRDILRRIDRVQMINNIMNDVKHSFTFPREDRKANLRLSTPDVDIFGNIQEEIKNAVEKALSDCISSAENLKMTVENGSWNSISIPLINNDPVTDDDNRDEEEEDERLNNVENNVEEENDLIFDLCDISSNQSFGETLNLTDYSQKKPDLLVEEGRFVRVAFKDQKTAVINKSSLCWLLDQKAERVSTDRLRRFIQNSKQSSKYSIKKSNKATYSNKINIGDWCVLANKESELSDCLKKMSDNTFKDFVFGRILLFKYLDKSRQETQCLLENVSVKSNATKNIGFLCTYYCTDTDGVLKLIETSNPFVSNLTDYICTIPHPTIEFIDNQIRLTIASDILENIKVIIQSEENSKKRRHKICPQKIRSRSKKIRNEFEDALTETETESSSEEEAFSLNDSTDVETFSHTSSDEDEDKEISNTKIRLNNSTDNNITNKGSEKSESKPLKSTITENEVISCFTESNNKEMEINLDDFIIVELATTRGHKKRFVGKIICLNPCRCLFLKASDKFNSRFKYPTVNDEGDVEKEEIIAKLPPPTVLRRGMLMFNNTMLEKYLY